MKEKINTCCFTGHRKMSPKDKLTAATSLATLIPKLLDLGVINFEVGGALGFDTLVAKELIVMKNVYPQIQIHLVLPCNEQDKYWSKEDKETYKYILNNSDSITYISNEYTQSCMLDRNKRMVDDSAVCIAWLCNSKGGTAFTFDYAKKQKLVLINLTDNDNL